GSYVDVVGGDIYDEALTDTAPWPGMDALSNIAQTNHKPFSVPEAGLSSVDDPAFVNHMCTFLEAHPSTEVYVPYESKAGSPYDLGTKPKSSLAYRTCMVPLAGALPEWAAANAPGGGASVTSLKLTPRPDTGAAPLAVTFQVDAKLTVPIQQWQLVFGHGTQTRGPGRPPAPPEPTHAPA